MLAIININLCPPHRLVANLGLPTGHLLLKVLTTRSVQRPLRTHCLDALPLYHVVRYVGVTLANAHAQNVRVCC